MVTTTATRDAHAPFSTLVANLATLAMGESIVTGLRSLTLRVENKGAEWTVCRLDDEMRIERAAYVLNELGMDQWEVKAVESGALVAKGAFDELTAALAQAIGSVR